MKRRRDDRALMWRPPPSSSSCDLCCAVVQSTLGLLTWPWGMAVWPLVAPPFFLLLSRLGVLLLEGSVAPVPSHYKEALYFARIVCACFAAPGRGWSPTTCGGCPSWVGGGGYWAEGPGRVHPLLLLFLSLALAAAAAAAHHRQGWSA